MKCINLPKKKVVSKKKSNKWTVSLPLELYSIPKKLFDEMIDYIGKGIQQEIDREQVVDRLKGEKVEGKIIDAITIQNITFNFSTIKVK